MPWATMRITSRSRCVSCSRRLRNVESSISLRRWLRFLVTAELIVLSSRWSSTGFCRKSIAPCLSVRTAMSMSPWPEMKMIGRSTPISRSLSWSSRPLMRGMRTSRTRHPGRWKSFEAMKSSASEYVTTSQPSPSMRKAHERRTASSSSMTRTRGFREVSTIVSSKQKAVRASGRPD